MATDKATVPDPPVTANVLLDALKLMIEHQGPRAAEMSEDTLSRLIGKLDGRSNRENPNNPRHSSFSYPEGDRARPKPTLLRETWHNSARVREDQCTPAEILAFNALSESLPKPGDERTSRDGRWIAKVSRDGAKLIVVIPCKTIEDHAEANNSTILMFCRELAEGQGVVTPETMAADVAQLKADRDRLEKLLAANGIVLPAPAAPA